MQCWERGVNRMRWKVRKGLETAMEEATPKMLKEKLAVAAALGTAVMTLPGMVLGGLLRKALTSKDRIV